jgi:hypothetical protein
MFPAVLLLALFADWPQGPGPRGDWSANSLGRSEGRICHRTAAELLCFGAAAKAR